MKTTLDHVVLEVRDVEASVEFYRRLLQFPTVRLEEWRAGEAPFASARVNAHTIVDFFPKKFWQNTRRSANPNHVCFTTDEAGVKALQRRMARAGVKILRRGKRNYGAEGYGSSIYFADPDGVTLEVRFYGPKKQGDKKRAR